MKSIIRIFVILIFFNLSPFFAFCNDIEFINLASEEWENNTNKDGTGLYWDIIREVYKLDKIEIKYKTVPYARSVQNVKTEKDDAWVASYDKEESFAIYPKWHFDADLVNALYKKKNFTSFKGVESLKNKTVGWIRGYDYDQYINVEMNKYEISTRQSALGLLVKNRIDVFLDAIVEINTLLTKKDLLKKMKFNRIDYECKKLLQLNLYLAFANNKRGKKLCEIWDKNFPILLKNKTIKILYDKYKNNVFPFEIGN